jgi:uncharacterized membrane protein
LALALSAAQATAQTTATMQRTQKTEMTPTTAPAATKAQTPSTTADATGSDATSADATGVADQATTGDAGAQVPKGRAIALLGKFHLLAVHFPIALLLAAALAEGLAFAFGSGGGARSLVAAARYCLWLAAISAVMAVAMGLANAASGGGAGMEVDLARHKWLGIGAAMDAVATLIVGELARRHDRRGAWLWAYRLLLLAGAILVALAGHFGGQLAFGPDYFQS